MATRLDLHALDDKLVATAPPLSDERGIGHRPPHPLAWCVEDSLDADLAIAAQSNRRSCHGFLLRSGSHFFSFVRSRNSPSLLRRPSSIRRYPAIHAVSS